VRAFLSAVIAVAILVPGSAVLVPGSAVAADRGNGSLVSAGPLPAALRLAGAGDAWRLSYQTVSWTGRPTVVTGTLTVPPGRPPAGGWRVVSFGHGANGVGDACAESNSGPPPAERVLLEGLLAAGYAVAVTDFEGIGTPADSPFIDGRSEARDMVDIVRAGRALAPLSRSFASVGYSLGGHAALFTAALAARYAPDLHLAGTVALAPLTQFGLLLSEPGVSDPAGIPTPWLPYEGNAFALTRPDLVRLTDWFTPLGLQLADLARTACITQVATAMAGLTNADLLRDPAMAVAQAKEVLAAQEIPVYPRHRPVVLFQGTADTAVPPPLTAITAEQLGATLISVPGADHITLPAVAAGQVVTRVRQLFG